jgi:hypothetical protein
MFNRSLGDAMRARDESAGLPVVDVTREEFVARAVASGMTESAAEFQANLAEAFGSRVRIGDEMLRIRAAG